MKVRKDTRTRLSAPEKGCQLTHTLFAARSCFGMMELLCSELFWEVLEVRDVWRSRSLLQELTLVLNLPPAAHTACLFVNTRYL